MMGGKKGDCFVSGWKDIDLNFWNLLSIVPLETLTG